MHRNCTTVSLVIQLRDDHQDVQKLLYNTKWQRLNNMQLIIFRVAAGK